MSRRIAVRLAGLSIVVLTVLDSTFVPGILHVATPWSVDYDTAAMWVGFALEIFTL